MSSPWLNKRSERLFSNMGEDSVLMPLESMCPSGQAFVRGGGPRYVCESLTWFCTSMFLMSSLSLAHWPCDETTNYT